MLWIIKNILQTNKYAIVALEHKIVIFYFSNDVWLLVCLSARRNKIRLNFFRFMGLNYKIIK